MQRRAKMKLLTLEGLEEYNVKWHERLQAMIIGDSEIDEISFEEIGTELPVPETYVVLSSGTMNLSLGTELSFEPEGAETKQMSVANSENVEMFWLKLIDPGNFILSWSNDIQWKDGSEPAWEAFNEYYIRFKKSENNKWVGQVIKSNAITPYWKISVQVPTNTIGVNDYLPNNISRNDINSTILLPFIFSGNNKTVEIDWGDGTINSTEQIDNQIAVGGYPYHLYANSGTYNIKIKSNVFNTSSICDLTYTEYFCRDIYGVTNYYHGILAYVYTDALKSINSPLPLLEAIHIGESSTTFVYERNSFRNCFYSAYNLSQIPEKLFANNPNIVDLSECFYNCSLKGFTLYITSSNVGNCSSFIPVYTTETRTIYVPASSSTYTHFNNEASRSYLTIVPV